MSDVLWLLEHSEDADASPEFAWSFLTEVANWDDPPARFALDGPFATGSRGTTRLPDREPIHWTIGDVRAGRSYTIETELDGATLLCEWRFDPILERRTRLTQRLGLSGDDTAAQAEGVRAMFAPTLAAGMRRIAGLIARTQARRGARP